MKELSKRHLFKENSPKNEGTYLLKLKAKEKPRATPIFQIVNKIFSLWTFIFAFSLFTLLSEINASMDKEIQNERL